MNLWTLERMTEAYSVGLSKKEQRKVGTEKECEFRVSLVKLLRKKQKELVKGSQSGRVIDELIGFNIVYANILTSGNIPWITKRIGIKEDEIYQKINDYEKHHRRIVAKLYPERAKAFSSRS